MIDVDVGVLGAEDAAVDGPEKPSHRHAYGQRVVGVMKTEFIWPPNRFRA